MDPAACSVQKIFAAQLALLGERPPGESSLQWRTAVKRTKALVGNDLWAHYRNQASAPGALAKRSATNFALAVGSDRMTAEVIAAGSEKRWVHLKGRDGQRLEAVEFD